MTTTMKIIWFIGTFSPIIVGWALAKLFGGVQD